MNIVAKTAAVVLAAAALCGLGIGTIAAAPSDQVSGPTSTRTDLKEFDVEVPLRTDVWKGYTELNQDRLGLGDGWGLSPGWVEVSPR
jgi:hypothetical protein